MLVFETSKGVRTIVFHNQKTKENSGYSFFYSTISFELIDNENAICIERVKHDSNRNSDNT
jgi:hypothetical protein